jgi:CelD/BcsL family acetyltransferase involved in cellulose biosynthesis
VQQALATIESLQEEWSDLADRVDAPPFLHPGWIAAWCHEFAGRQVSVLAVRRDGRLVGLVPFLEVPTGIVAPTNWHTPRFGLLAEDAEARRELCRLLVERARHRLDVCFLYGGSDELRDLRAAAAEAGHRVQTRTCQRSPFVEVDGDWDAYEERVPSKRLREVRRRRRKLSAQGAVTIDFARPGADDLDDLLGDGFSVGGSGWKNERGTAILSSPETRSFYTEVAGWAAARGWLTLAFLRVDGRPAAFDMCLEAHGRIYVLKGGYDTELRSFAPRTILLYESLRRAFASGARSYEFLGADEKYKLPWATGTRDCIRLQSFPQSLTGVTSYVAFRFGRPAAKRALELRRRLGSS